jgi:hypothetical protein
MESSIKDGKTILTSTHTYTLNSKQRTFNPFFRVSNLIQNLFNLGRKANITPNFNQSFETHNISFFLDRFWKSLR